MLENEEDRGIVLSCQLVGIKNLKSTHNWRIELDVFEMDSHKVKQLIDLIDKPVVTAIVENE
tara:strand:- start:1766 stop:1951 length:186 start_codon:yes stop_codon:yes gene_type:complete